MKKEELTTLGLTDEQAAKVLELNQTDITEATKETVPRTRLNEVIEERNARDKTIAERDKQLEELKKSAGDADAMKQQIEQLQADNKAAKAKFDADILKLKLDNAAAAELAEAGAVNVDAAKRLLGDFLATAKLGDDGKITGFAEKITALKGEAYASSMFKTANPKSGLSGLKPGESGDGNPGGTGKKPSEMSYSELAEYLAKNPDAKLEG